jgi:TupA-like ATPgrasp
MDRLSGSFEGKPFQELTWKRIHHWYHPESTHLDSVRDEISFLKKIDNKIEGYKFAMDNGVAVPKHKLLESIQLIRSDSWVSSLKSFVVKPQDSHSSRGVYILSDAGEGKFHCSMNGITFASIDEFIEHYITQQSEGKWETFFGHSVIVEEAIEDSHGFSPSMGYKVFAFWTGSPIVMQLDHNKYIPQNQWKYTSYDESGKALGPIWEGSGISHQPLALPAPRNLDSMVSMANRLVKAARASFVRMDFYDTPNGAVFGEFTPIPSGGRKHFSPEYENILHKYWADSLKFLAMEY